MGFLFGGILLAVFGYNPLLAYYYMFYGALGSLSNVTDMLGNAAPLILTALTSALLLSLAVIPLWAFSSGLYKLALGAFLMQVGVQGAWGIIPAHLNELAPDTARGLIPGLAYQLGILFASPVNQVEHHLYLHVGYRWALGGFELANIVLLTVIVLLGHERKGRAFVREHALE